jgi:hypothetical protein
MLTRFAALVAIAFMTLVCALIGPSFAQTAACRWMIVGVACGNGASTICDHHPAATPPFATEQLCQKGLAAYVTGMRESIPLCCAT